MGTSLTESRLEYRWRNLDMHIKFTYTDLSWSQMKNLLTISMVELISGVNIVLKDRIHIFPLKRKLSITKKNLKTSFVTFFSRKTFDLHVYISSTVRGYGTFCLLL